MATGLILPRSVFLDTCHLRLLYDTSRGRRDDADERSASYRTLLRAIDDGVLVPVVGAEQPYEWDLSRADVGDELVSVLERAPQCKIAADLDVAVIIEVAHEAARLLGPNRQPLPAPLHVVGTPDRATLLVLAPHCRATENDLCFSRPRDLLSHARRVGPREAWVLRRWQESAQGMHDHVHAVKSRSWEWQVDRLREWSMLSDVLRHLGYPEVQTLWGRLDRNRCPLLNLWQKFWWRYVSNRQGRVETNDPEDLSFATAWVYSDFALIDRRMAARVREADSALGPKVSHEPADLVSFLGLGQPPPGLGTV